MQTKAYNGYTNYETWSVMLLIDNDQGQQEHYAEVARSLFAMGVDSTSKGVVTRSDAARYALADTLKQDHEDGAQEMLESAGRVSSIYDQLLKAALSEVDWDECADCILRGAEIEGYEPREE